jgi:GDP-L-fucose synthase
MKVLITGGAGFVGRYFTIELLKEKHEVTVVDSLVSGTGGLHPIIQKWHCGDPCSFEKFTFLQQDCRDFFKEAEAQEFELIIHLAAIVGGRLVIEQNPLAVAEDLEIDSSFWRWISTARQSHVISFSSSAAYPISLQTKEMHRPLLESDINFKKAIGVPDLSYGWAKLTSEFLGLLTHEKHGIKIANYRPFSGYGPDQDLTYPFPSIMKRAVEHPGDNKEFLVWGSGLQERDFIHIRNVVSGVLSTYDKIINGQSVNLGTGLATNFIELSNIALQNLNKKAIVLGKSEMPEGVFSRIADTTLAISSYGMQNNIELKDGVVEGLNYWMR